MSIDLGLLVLRTLIGLIIAGHGAQKLFGWWNGYGLDGTAGWLGSIGLAPPRLWAYLAAVGESAGGILLALGLLTPLAVLPIIASMAMAIGLAHWSNGFWALKNGYEYPLTIGGTAFALGLTGPGSASLDGVLGLAFPPWVFLVGLVVVAGVVCYGLFLHRRQVAVQQAG